MGDVVQFSKDRRTPLASSSIETPSVESAKLIKSLRRSLRALQDHRLGLNQENLSPIEESLLHNIEMLQNDPSKYATMQKHVSNVNILLTYLYTPEQLKQYTDED